MKIRAALRESWNSQKASYDELGRLVDNRFRADCASRRWHYESRVKSLDSFALKIETGRVAALDKLEDFFGATIVVQNSSQIGGAIALVEQFCDIVYRRPPIPNETSHRSSNFAFDDLRLYVRLKTSPGSRPSVSDDLIFEIQLKTFLMHAWAIATHDLLYKSDQLSWARERIAFQVRAMLEHAEITIQQADQLAGADQLAREDKETAELKILTTVLEQWPIDQLSQDRRRLAQNIRDLLKLLKLKPTDYAGWVSDIARGGSLPLDVGPYQHAVQLVLANKPDAVRQYADRSPGKAKLVIYAADLPDWIAADHPNFLVIAAD